MCDIFIMCFVLFLFVTCFGWNFFHGGHVVVFPYFLAQLVVFGRDVAVLYGAVEGFVRWQLADVQFLQRGHPLVREKALLLRTFISFQVLTITKTKSHVVGDVQELQRLCLDAHEVVVSLHGILDHLALHQLCKKIHLHGIDVILAGVESHHWQFLQMSFKLKR